MTHTTVNIIHLTLTPRDPLIARDGRPFTDGLRMRSLDWLYPSVLAGSLRTLAGHLHGGFARPDGYDALVTQLKTLSVAGPFPVVGKQLFFPAPQDVVVRRNTDRTLSAFAARPVQLSKYAPGAGCDLPGGLTPALLPDEVGEDFKPERVPAFWSCGEITRWLANAAGRNFLESSARDWSASGYLNTPKKDVRTHVKMNPASGVGAEGMLFQTTGLDLQRLPRPGDQVSDPVEMLEDGLSARVRWSDAAELGMRMRKLDEWHPLGGERRLVHWRAGSSTPGGWQCPQEIADSLKGQRLVRLVLATPAIFADGWKPKWLQPESESGTLAGVWEKAGLKLRLISACVERWRPISGWGYEPKHVDGHARWGPKPVQRLVPAGGVYFFQVLKGDPATLADHWLESVCDDEQNQRDGFGLALWGVWAPADAAHTFEP